MTALDPLPAENDVMGADEAPRFIERLAKRLCVPEDDAAGTAQAVFEALVEHLIAGGEWSAPGFGRFHLLQKRSELVTDPESGHCFVRPPESTVAIELDSAFENRLEAIRPRGVLCALGEDDPLPGRLIEHVQPSGWHVRRSEDPATCVRLLDEGVIRLVIADMTKTAGKALLQRVKLRRRFCATAMLSLYPKDHNPLRSRNFEIFPDDHFVGEYDFPVLLRRVERLLRRANDEAARGQRLHRVKFAFMTRPEHIERAGAIGEWLISQGGLDSEHEVAFAAAFREAIANAAEHGNHDDPRRRIAVRYVHDGTRLQFTVRDEGKGFDHRRALELGRTGDAERAERLRRQHPTARAGGLGIMLMQKCADRVVYNDAGNEVTLVKRVP